MLRAADLQLEREDIAVNFDSMLAPAVFAGNSLARVGGVAPRSVVFGGRPSALPPPARSRGGG
eukprot:7931981-Pyramimonas_sp.AAC.1